MPKVTQRFHRALAVAIFFLLSVATTFAQAAPAQPKYPQLPTDMASDFKPVTQTFDYTRKT